MPSNFQQQVRNASPYVIEEATIVSYDPRDPRSLAIRTSGGRVIRNCTGATGGLSSGVNVLVVINRFGSGAVVIGTIQDAQTVASAGGVVQSLNPPANLAVVAGVRFLAAQWDFYPGNNSVCYQVQHNAAAAEDGSEVSALVTKGSQFVYACATGTTRYFRVRALQYLSASNMMYSAWSSWVSGTPLVIANADLPVVDIAHGGTGQTTQQAAINALLPSQIGHVSDALLSDGTSAYWGPVGGGGGGGGAPMIANLPVGTIVAFGADTVPTGWLNCDGSAVSRTVYADLFAICGVVFGAGNGSTTFNLPDLRGRAGIGVGQGSGLTNRVIAAKSGAEGHPLSVNELAVHHHRQSQRWINGGEIQGYQDYVGGVGPIGPVDSFIDSFDTGQGLAHNNMQPFLVVKYIIKAAIMATSDLVDHGLLAGLADNDHPQYQLVSGKGAASGYAGLDANIKVPIAQLPTGATSSDVSLGNHTHAGGSGDVVGPASAVDSRIAVFDGVTGKLIKDGGQVISGLATSGHTHAGANGGKIEIGIDGGGLVPSTGVLLDFVVPVDLTITDWTLLANESGSIVIDLWQDTYANYPPTVADTVTGSAKPTLSSATKNTSSTLTGWTTNWAAGSVIRVNIDSVSTLKRATLILSYTF